MNLVEQICNALESGPRIEEEDAIRKAAFLIEKSLGREPVGWDDCVVEETVGPEELKKLRESLEAYVHRNLVPDPMAGAIWALSLLEDVALKPLFARCLRLYAQWSTNTAALYQSMLALEQLGERLFSERGSSLRDLEANLRVSREYLDRAGGED